MFRRIGRSVDRRLTDHPEQGGYRAESGASAALIERELLEAAYSGLIPEGLLQRGYHAKRAEVAEKRGNAIEQHGNLTDQVAALEAELEALVEQAPPAPPVPTVLRSLGTILPFGKGQQNHG